MPHINEMSSLGVGHIYVLGFERNQVKVGRSQHPRVRIRDLRAKARRQGVRLVDGWYSDEHVGWRLNEIRMIAFCLENFGDPVYGIETFRADYATVLAFAQPLAPAAVAA